MAVGCGAKCAKIILFIFNFIFWLSGCAILGIGIWMLVDKSIFETLDLFTLDGSDPLVQYAAYVLIGIGVFVFFVGFCGCCGALRESQCMLGIYIFLLLLVMIGELAAGIMALIYKDKILAKATEVMKEKLHEDAIYSLVDGKANFTAFGLTMSLAQQKFECCGVDSWEDYANGAFENSTMNAFPLTCCEMKEDFEMKELSDLDTGVKDKTKCIEKTEDFFYNDGCKDGLETFFESHTIIVIGAGIGIACIEIFGIIFAICLCRQVGDE